MIYINTQSIKNESVWRYYVDHYFPFMYGLLLIETLYIYNGNDSINPREEYYNKVIDYYDKENLLYQKEDMDFLMNISMKLEFSRVLLNRHDRYKDNKVVIKCSNIASDLVKRSKKQKQYLIK